MHFQNTGFKKELFSQIKMNIKLLEGNRENSPKNFVKNNIMTDEMQK